jgi:hypothetical protein
MKDIKETVSKLRLRQCKAGIGQAYIPNNVEMAAIKECGIGVYSGKEYIFCKRIPQGKSSMQKTAERASELFKLTSAEHPSHQGLLILLRTPGVPFDDSVMESIESAQKGLPYFCLYERSTNDSLEHLKQEYERKTRSGREVIPVIDVAVDSHRLLRKKLMYLASKKPARVIVIQRNFIENIAAYADVMNHFVPQETRLILAGLWPR